MEPPDSHHFSAAVGWLELGNHAEARVELGKLGVDQFKNPDVLEVSWLIDAGAGDWISALVTARRLVEVDPARSTAWLHQAYAIRRVPEGGLQAAWDALLPAADRFPNEPTIAYNLACYACQMERADEAREWMQRAISVGNKTKLKTMALADSDLKPLWNEIKDW